MPKIVLSFFLGIIAYHFIFQHLWLLIVITLLGFLTYKIQLLKYWLILISGIFWIFIYISWQNLWTLPSNLEGVPITTKGYIASLPEKKAQCTTFLFETDHFEKPAFDFFHSGLVKCTWENAPSIQIGEQWQLNLKLKKPHASQNPGGLDYETWLFSHKIHATGKVLNHANNLKCGIAFFAYYIDRLRQDLSKRIDELLFDSATKGLIKALAIGDQGSISESQWKVLRQTGTNHLFAIAGLHIGFIAYLVFNFVTWCIKRNSLSLRTPAQHIGALCALFTGFLYSVLAGFSLPTKRAIIMLAIFLFAKLKHFHINAWQGWSIALGILLLINPLQILTESFWLSFTAVGSLIYGFQNVIAVDHKFTHKILHGIKTQWITSIALIPLSLLFFQQASLISFFANFIAIPCIGFCIAPLSLLGSLLIYIPFAGSSLIRFANFLLHYFWPLLEIMGSLPKSQWYQAIVTPWSLGTMSIAILLLLTPKAFPGRVTSLLWILPLLFHLQKNPRLGEIRFTLLDVGQGLSAVVRTSRHILIFDTGARYKNIFDSGESIILPFLRYWQINQIDTLIVSHGDNDHIGGSTSLLQNISTQRIVTSVPERFKHPNTINCIAGQKWRWDGVDFEILHPPLGSTFKGNNRSCVLKITTPTHGLLLTGDIEKSAENTILTSSFKKLKSDVLVAPHHGSKTSSTEAFIHAVSPSIVLFPVGYQNQYHLPSPIIVDRYKRKGIKTYDSVNCGAIDIVLSASQKMAVNCYRKENQYY